ncbi:recombination protein RecR [Candidatus Gottesmanbacteria bacterium]|nr:recombination protein RecR [Candidatus Gottesmanbacteria bacterium]
MVLPKAIRNLITSFEKLPGIGPKSAARLTYYLLHVPQSELDEFSEAVKNLKLKTVTCSICLNVSETEPCSICADGGRDKETICVVEQPLDIVALEKANKYKGRYHVLHGAISPLNNIGPDEIHIEELLNRAKNDDINEIILATSLTMEGEATAMYLAKAIRQQDSHHVKITRIAHGLPVGADLEYADELTLGKALEGRREY